MADPEGIPFELVRLHLLKSLFRRNASWPGQEEGRIAVGAITLNNSGAFSREGDAAKFVQSLKTGEGGPMPFSLEIEFGAAFSMSRPVPRADRAYYIQSAFPRLVFPFMREYVAETTRRGGFPPLMINMAASPGPGDGPSGEAGAAPVIKWFH